MASPNELVDLLKSQSRRIVFAESCTAGLVAARLAEVPGVSNYLCGSAVTYREATKAEWLDVSLDQIQQFTAVSDEVTRAMADGVLRRTQEADIAAAVTGHLGPDAPKSLDGVIFIAVADRRSNTPTKVLKSRLVAKSRQDRQLEASNLVLATVFAALSPAE